MSRNFNTGKDKITGEMMEFYAAKLLRKSVCDVTAREAAAALPALRAYCNGAAPERVQEIFQTELKSIIEGFARRKAS